MCGLGIAYLPYITIKSELEQKKLIALPWENDIALIATQLIYHKSKWISPALNEFLCLLLLKAEIWRDESNNMTISNDKILKINGLIAD